MSPEELRAQGYRIKAVLDALEGEDAFGEIEADIMREWKACHDPAERQNLWLSIRLLEKLRIWLASKASHDLTALRRVK